MKTYRKKYHFNQNQNSLSLGEFLQRISKLDEAILGDAAAKGAVWLQSEGKGPILRERELSRKLADGDLVSLYYDPKILSLSILTKAEVLFESKHYGVWFKAAGTVTQGTETGDHTSLLRYIEKAKNQDIFLVQRLDRETAGVIIFAYTQHGAAKLSDLFQNRKVKKVYQAIVLGEIPIGEEKVIDFSLDGKKAITKYKSLANRDGKTLLEVQIETGRLHQIRRHLDMIGFPVMGDPKYGKGNKNREGLQLLAYSLEFNDPWTKKSVSWNSPKSLVI